MADSDQILQLGIEEARNGNREAARNLFELLTRQEPDNAQAWLWLAGVADGPDQRREALQRVLALDPENEMARKGLQAMGVSTSPAPVAPARAPAAPAIEPEPDLEPEPVAAAEPSRSRSADEEFADELDLAFTDDYASIPRAESAPRREESLTEVGDGEGSGDSGSAAQRRGFERPTLRRPSPRVRPRVQDDDDDDESPRRGPPRLLWALLAVAGALVVLFLLWNLLNPGNKPPPIAEQPTAAAEQPTVAPGAATPAPGTDATAAPGAEQPTAAPGAEQPTAAPGAEQPTAAPGAEAPTAAPAGEAPTAAPSGPPPEQANPAPVAVGTTLQANGWSYSYPNAAYSVVLGKTAGGQTAQGSFVHVLVWVTNGTGSAQALPADFFVLKDAQGRVYTALPQVSSALVQRGVNADLSMEDQVPANGVTTSVYLVFDVQPGATDLTLFARGNPAQGFKLNLNVQ